MTNRSFDFQWSTAQEEGSRRDPTPSFAVLEGPAFYLRPVQPADYPMLQFLETHGENAQRWRFRGLTPSPEDYMQKLWSGILVQYLIVERSTDAPLALVYAYRASMQDRHAYFAVLRFENERPTPLVMLGLALFIEYLFKSWSFVSLHAEVPAFNMHQFESGLGRIFEVEGRLRNHYSCAGRMWDMFILSIHYDPWRRQSGRVLAAAVGRDPRRVQVRISSGSKF